MSELTYEVWFLEQMSKLGASVNYSPEKCAELATLIKKVVDENRDLREERDDVLADGARLLKLARRLWDKCEIEGALSLDDHGNPEPPRP